MNSVLKVPENAFVHGEAQQSALLVDARAYYCAFYRALERAEHYALVSGWQFDSGVKLLRGEDAESATHPVELLEFLAALCEERPSLVIHILAWDFSVFYASERESSQREKFLAKNSRIRFEWDKHPELTGSHHQKFVVVDGAVAFIGGIDLCDARWDDRSHHAHDPKRVNISGEPCKPYHDVQAAITGPLVGSLVDVFVDRWGRATKERLELTAPALATARFDLDELSAGIAEPIAAKHAALSRTQVDSRAEPALVGEVMSLFAAAITSARRLIYIETQYFTSRSLACIFTSRLADASLPKLDIVVIMPRGADSGLEKFVLADAQENVLVEVLETARTYGHTMRLMYPASSDDQGGEQPTFIHSKLMIVDDRLLIVGSANLTERSVALDSELTVSWECSDASHELGECIRNIRTRLLAEHSGLPATEFEAQEGLCEKLGRLIDERSCRLRHRALGDAGVFGPVLAELFDAGASELTRTGSG